MVRCTSAGNTVWTEWEMSGTRLDGGEHLMRGVSIFEVEGDVFTTVRFYMEPVERGGVGVDDAVMQAVGR